jgi:signal transduction histidine kinase
MAEAQPVATILVVDDDPFIRATTGVYLRSRGFSVLEAENGRRGLEMFYAHGPDLLLVDLKMPVMDGLELLANLSGALMRTPVLVFSGEGGLDEAVEALRRGAWDYLVKPIPSLSVLDHAVNKALERAALIRENENYRLNLEQQVLSRTEELRKANRELEIQFHKQQKLGIIGTLAGGMAHDFNNILSAITFSNELIREAAQAGDPPDQEDMDRISRVCQRGASLIRSILHFTGKMHEEFVLFPLSSTLRETLNIIKGTTPSRIEIAADIADNLGLLFGDPAHVQQIVMNLVANAIHAMRDRAAPCLRITARLCPEDQRGMMVPPSGMDLVLLTVADNGEGVEDVEDVARLCDPFFTTKPPDEGTGLGLFVTKKFVKSLKGNLRIESTPGAGTTISVFLPATPGLDLVWEDSPYCPLPHGLAERILVIESHPEVRASICSLLARLGFQSCAAPNFEHGLGMILASSQRYDLVLAEDASPDELNSLCAAITHSSSSTRIALITNQTRAEMRRLYPSVCVTIPKPIDLTTLAQTLESCLRRAIREI